MTAPTREEQKARFDTAVLEHNKALGLWHARKPPYDDPNLEAPKLEQFLSRDQWPD